MDIVKQFMRGLSKQKNINYVLLHFMIKIKLYGILIIFYF